MDLTRHHYDKIHLTWTGNLGRGTADYRAYTRDHEVTVPGKHPLMASADKTFHGDRSRWNPEELLISALAQCHMLTYFHLATQAGIVVTAYEDDPEGEMRTDPDGIGGAFTSVTLHPRMTISVDGGAGAVDGAITGVAGDAEAERARQSALDLHTQVPGYCFIARSVNFPVRHEPEVAVEGTT